MLDPCLLQDNEWEKMKQTYVYIYSPVSLGAYELIYWILAHKYHFLVYLLALFYKNWRGILARKYKSA